MTDGATDATLLCATCVCVSASGCLTVPTSAVAAGGGAGRFGGLEAASSCDRPLAGTCITGALVLSSLLMVCIGTGDGMVSSVRTAHSVVRCRRKEEEASRAESGYETRRGRHCDKGAPRRVPAHCQRVSSSVGSGGGSSLASRPSTRHWYCALLVWLLAAVSFARLCWVESTPTAGQYWRPIHNAARTPA
jgi:hypothetical protein